MANTRTITSANGILMLGVMGLYDTPRQMQGFAADSFTDIGDLTNKETAIGVDGKMSAGYVFTLATQNITLQADSESNDFFENIGQAEAQRRETYWMFGTLLLRATGRRYTMTRGVLSSRSLLPALNRTLQPRRYTITWEKVTAAPV